MYLVYFGEKFFNNPELLIFQDISKHSTAKSICPVPIFSGIINETKTNVKRFYQEEKKEMKPEFIKQFEKTLHLLKSIENPDKQISQDSWMIREIVGHLIDSVANNHQRLVRYLPGEEFSFPGYDQELCVKRGGYGSFNYDDLVSLWDLYNRLLLHIYGNISGSDLKSKIKVGDRPGVTIEELMADYFAHMKLHEKQIREAM